MLQGLLTPIVAVITTYIAWQQWKTNQRKVDLDRYDRRLKVYQETIKYIQQFNQDFKVQLPDLYSFYVATAEADFLFSPEIRAYIDEIYSRALKHHAAKSQYRDSNQPPIENYDHKAVCAAMEQQQEWFIDQPKHVLSKFKIYLDISQ